MSGKKTSLRYPFAGVMHREVYAWGKEKRRDQLDGAKNIGAVRQGLVRPIIIPEMRPKNQLRVGANLSEIRNETPIHTRSRLAQGFYLRQQNENGHQRRLQKDCEEKERMYFQRLLGEKKKKKYKE